MIQIGLTIGREAHTRDFQVSDAPICWHAREVPNYLVESYSGRSETALAEARERARQTAELAPGVRYLRTTFLSGDETILHVFEAPSAAALENAGRRAALQFERVVEAMEGSTTDEQTRTRRATRGRNGGGDRSFLVRRLVASSREDNTPSR